MGKLSSEFLQIYDHHRKKIEAVERETAAAIAALLDRIEAAGGASAPAPVREAASSAPAAPVAVEEIKPITEIDVSDACKILLIKADITRLPVDAIVNPASSSLQGGGGIEGAIFRLGGPKLVEECKALHGVERGEAKITGGHNLPARHVIHTVGPVWKGGDHGEPEMLGACYQHSLTLALDNGLKSIAFPGISTGNFGYPLLEASRVAVREVAKFVTSKPGLENVYLVGFTEDAIQAYAKAMMEIASK